MAGSIVNLGELVPGIEGKTFRLPQGDGFVDYHVPGDLDSETVFTFLALFEKMVEYEQEVKKVRDEAEQKPDETSLAEVLAGQTDALHKLTDEIKAKLLVVFQVANPELKSLPFGTATTMVVLGEILEMMGLAEKAHLPEPPRPPQNRAARRATARKTTKPRTKKAS